MAVALKLDLIESSEFTVDSKAGRAARIGILYGLDTSDATLVLLKAYQYMISLFPAGTLYPGTTNLVVQSFEIRPASHNSAYVVIRYETPDFGGVGVSAYLIRDSSSLQSYQTNFVPGMGTPIRVDWKYPIRDPGGSSAADVPEDYVPMTFLRPVRQLEVSALVYGRPGGSGVAPVGLDKFVNPVPNPDPSSLVGSVNDGVWQGKAAGYWMISGFQSELAKFQGYYQYSATATTKNNEDWSEIGVLFNNRYGKLCKVTDADHDAVYSAAYTHGIIMKKNGIIKVGPYPTVSFTGVFGF